MVLVARESLDKTPSLTDVENLSILGLDQGSVLLFSAVTSNASRNSTIPRTIIGGIQLRNGEEKIYYRHPSVVKITHASINATRSLCCFVTRTEIYEAFVAEIGAPNSGRLFSLNFSRSSPIRAYLAPHDIILLLYRDVVTVFRMPNSGSAIDQSTALDRDAQLNDCIYFQWDALEQRLHAVHKRPQNLITTKIAEGDVPFLYTMYTVNAKGQFDSIIRANFDLRVPPTSSSFGNFEILSSSTSLYLCWQLTMEKETEKVEYAIVSLGHGRTFSISKQLKKENWEIFKSRKLHFGLLNGDYVFADLRGEFTHIINFNIPLNFTNHLFLSNVHDSLPYDTKYTTQRGLPNGTLTLIYGIRTLSTYTVEIDPDQLIKSVSSATVHSILSYAIVAMKDGSILRRILEKILYELYDDLDTKNYLMEALTGLIFMQISRRYNHKYAWLFPATTVSNHHTVVTDVAVRTALHHREYLADRAGTNNLDPDFWAKLGTSFSHTRKYRPKLPYFHPIMTESDVSDSFDEPFSPTDRQSSKTTTPPASVAKETRNRGFGIFDFGRRRPSVVAAEPMNIPRETQRSPLLFVKKNDYLYQNIIRVLTEKQKHMEWGKVRTEEIALEFVQATQDQCNYLMKSFINLARFSSTQGMVNDNTRSASEKHKPLLAILEKLYLAMVESGFSPTDELQQTLLDVSFRVMPFDEFVAALDHNILTLTHEFVQETIKQLDKDNPLSYTIGEQLILMLRDVGSDSQSGLFDSFDNNRAKRMSAQIQVARSFSADRRQRAGKRHDAADASDELQVDEIVNPNTHSRLIEQAAVTFYRDCSQRNVFDKDELRTVKTGLLTLATPTP